MHPGVSEHEELMAALRDMNQLLSDIRWELQTGRKTYYKTMARAAAAPFLHDITQLIGPTQLDMLDTLAYLKSHHVSFLRFGDGELQLMLRPDYSQAQQRNSPDVAGRLQAILTDSQRDDVLLSLPLILHDENWLGTWTGIWDDLRPLLESAQWPIYGTAHASRPIFFQYAGQQGVAAWRSLWDHAKATVITGDGSRFTLVPQLFDNLRSVEYLYSRPTNAAIDVDRVVAELQSCTSDVFLISLGPAGTILTSELAKSGKWALDIGHLSDSYQFVFGGDRYPESKPLFKNAES